MFFGVLSIGKTVSHEHDKSGKNDHDADHDVSQFPKTSMWAHSQECLHAVQNCTAASDDGCEHVETYRRHKLVVFFHLLEFSFQYFTSQEVIADLSPKFGYTSGKYTREAAEESDDSKTGCH